MGGAAAGCHDENIAIIMLAENLRGGIDISQRAKRLACLRKMDDVEMLARTEYDSSDATAFSPSVWRRLGLAFTNDKRQYLNLPGIDKKPPSGRIAVLVGSLWLRGRICTCELQVMSLTVMP